MTHEALVARLKKKVEGAERLKSAGFSEMYWHELPLFRAALEVVEDHVPFPDEGVHCEECGGESPCKTYRAFGKAVEEMGE